MRLGQLSRRLGLKASDIQAFLKQLDQSVEAGPNTRLTDEQVALAVRHFDPAQEAAILAENTVGEKEEVVAVPEETQSPEAPAEIVESSTDETTGESSTETTVEPTPEVIRVQKQELPGRLPASL